MFKLKKGTNTVQLSLTSSFTPLLEFKNPYTGDIKLSKQDAGGNQKKEATIEAEHDEILDLSSYREYFTAYKDNYIQLIITLNAAATLEYEQLSGSPSIDFGLEEDPNYKPPEPEAQRCPICDQEVPISDLTIHIQANHM